MKSNISKVKSLLTRLERATLIGNEQSDASLRLILRAKRQEALRSGSGYSVESADARRIISMIDGSRFSI